MATFDPRALVRRLPGWPVLRRLLRPILPGWPDEGRGIAQGKTIQNLLSVAEADLSHNARALNAGAGQGLYSPPLLALAPVDRVVEIDLSYATSRRQLTDPRQRAAAASLTGIPFAARSFDLILCSEVLEHIEDDGSAFDELARVLAPGGQVVITVPTPPAPPDPAHVREGYTADEMRGHLEARGLVVREVRFCMYGWFKWVLRNWRPGRMPRGLILGLAWLDRLAPVGTPMDLAVLAVKEAAPGGERPGS